MGAVVDITPRLLVNRELTDAAPFIAQAHAEGWNWAMEHNPRLGWSVYVTAAGCAPALGEGKTLALAAEAALTKAAHRNLERQLAASRTLTAIGAPA